MNSLYDRFNEYRAKKRVHKEKVLYCCQWMVRAIHKCFKFETIGIRYLRTYNHTKESDMSISCLQEMIRWLEELGLCISLSGYIDFYEDVSMRSMLIFNVDEIFKFVDVARIDSGGDVGRINGVPVIFREKNKKGDKVEVSYYKLTDDDKRAKKEIKHILLSFNNMLRKHSVSYKNETFYDIFFKRIYGKHINELGRFYDSSGVQYLPSNERKKITIGGKETCSLDFKSFHPRIIHELEGNSLSDDFDPYLSNSEVSIEGIDDVRNLSKKALICMFNCKTKVDAKRAIAKKFNDKEERIAFDVADAVIESLEEKNSDIRSYFYREFFKELQNKESDVMFEIVKIATEDGKPFVPVHDEVICRVEDKEYFQLLMRESYAKILGTDINCIIEDK